MSSSLLRDIEPVLFQRRITRYVSNFEYHFSRHEYIFTCSPSHLVYTTVWSVTSSTVDKIGIGDPVFPSQDKAWISKVSKVPKVSKVSKVSPLSFPRTNLHFYFSSQNRSSSTTSPAFAALSTDFLPILHQNGVRCRAGICEVEGTAIL